MQGASGSRWRSGARRRAFLLSLLLHLLGVLVLLLLPPIPQSPPALYTVDLLPPTEAVEGPVPVPKPPIPPPKSPALSPPQKVAQPTSPTRGASPAPVAQGLGESPGARGMAPERQSAPRGETPTPPAQGEALGGRSSPTFPLGPSRQGLTPPSPPGTGGVGESPFPSALQGEERVSQEALLPLGERAQGVSEGVPPLTEPPLAKEGLAPSAPAGQGASSPPGGPVLAPVPASVGSGATPGDGEAQAPVPGGRPGGGAREGVGLEGLVPSRGGGTGGEGGRCAVVVELRGLPYAQGPSPAILDPGGRQVWPDPERVRGCPRRWWTGAASPSFSAPGSSGRKGMPGSTG